MGVIRHVLKHDRCEAESDRRQYEKVCVTLLRKHMQLVQTKDSFLEEITEGFPRKCCFLEFANLTLGETAEPIFLWT